MGIERLYDCWKQSSGIETDSRKVKKGQMFFALRGDNFDGNVFAGAALEKEASYVIVDDESLSISGDNRIILVENVLQTLQDLARHHREHLNIPILSITGSNGKTTTKELTRDVLAKKYKVLATLGNLNNHIGVPLTLLSITDDIEIAIIEMGANHQGEIDLLCNIVKPNYCMITNIGKAHMEGFDGIEGIKKGKSEMYRYVASHDGKIFINTDDEVLVSLLPEHAVIIPYKSSEIIQIVLDESLLVYKSGDKEYFTNIYGAYNIQNIAFSIRAGQYFNVDTDDIHQAVTSYKSTNNRSQLFEHGDNRIILDAYNANPTSMQASIESFVRLGGDQVVVLGDMFELGEYSREEHLKIIDLVEQFNFIDIIYIGNMFYSLSSGKSGHFFNNIEEAKAYFKSQNYQDKNILMKGSRGIAVEKILN